MSVEFWMLYVTTVFVASIVPGPSMLLALTHGVRYGFRRSIATALGNTTASVLQAAVSAVGLGALLVASESIFHVVKWAGAAYLVYLGITLWRSPAIQVQRLTAQQLSEAGKTPLRRLFWQGFLVAIGNPKAIVFFTALFPQFISTDSTPIPQMVLLLLTLACIAFMCMMIYAIGGHHITPLFVKTALAKYINRTIAGIFMGSGIGLAFSKR
jgi:threonine/homoserine/homoserine lactone efflux protein